MKACKIISLSIFAILACISCNSRQIEDNSPIMEVIVQETSPNTLKGVIRLTDKDNISRIGLLYWQADDSLQTTEMLVLDDVQTGDNPFELQNLQYRTTYVLIGFADAEQGADYKYAINSSPTIAMTDIELPDAEYQLVFSDEFDEDGAPSSQWTCETTSISSRGPLWTDNEENVYVKDGCLHIVMTEASDINKMNYSASLNTRKSFSMCYGKLECRLKIPFEQRCRSELILFGNMHSWPESGEIDVALLEDCKINSAIGWGSEEKWMPTWERNSIPLDCISADNTNNDIFHVIRLEWDRDSIRTWCDDNPILEADLSGKQNKGIYGDVNTNNPFVYYEDGFGYYITLQLDSKSFIEGMAEMQVDYIRIWQRKRLPEE